MNDDSKTPPSESQAPKSRSFLRSCLFRGPFGCLFLGAGLVIVGIAILPMVLNRVGAGQVNNLVDRKIEGRLQVRDLHFAWFSRQTATGILEEPGGAQVGELRLTAPALSHYRGGTRDLGDFEVSFDLDLEVDELGQSNFARAIAQREPGPQDPDESEPPEADEEESKGGDLGELFSRRVRIEIGESSIDFHSKDPAAKFRTASVEGLVGELSVTPGRGLEFTLDATVTEPAGGRLEVRVALPDPGSTESDLEPRFAVLAEGLPVEMVDGLIGASGQLTAWLGAEADLRAAWIPEAEALADLTQILEQGAIEWSLESPRAELRQRIGIEGEQFRIEPGGTMQLRPDPRAFESLAFGGEDPIRVVPRGPALVEIEVKRGQLSLPTAEAEGPAWLDWLAGADLDLELRSSGMDLVGTALEASLAPAQLLLSTDPTGGVHLGIRSGFGRLGEEPGSWTADVELEPASLAAFAEGQPMDPPARLETRLRGIPSDLVDGFTGAGELVTGVLGAAIDVEVTTNLRGLRDADLVAEVSSSLANAKLAGALEGDRFSVRPLEGEQGSGLSFSLTPLSNAALVGRLVPVLASVEAAEAGGRARLDLLSAVLPLNGDLSALEGEWLLDLGKIRANLLPGLANEVASLAAGSKLDWIESIEPFRLSVRDGRVTYPDLELSVDGRRFPIQGGFDLSTLQLDLSTLVSLDRVGGDVGRFLSEAREVLPADFGVPLAIRGTPLAPQVTVTEEFRSELPNLLLQGATNSLQEKLEDSLEKELERGLKKLFGGK